MKVADGPFMSGNAAISDAFVFKPHFGVAIISKFDATSSAHDVLELDHALFNNANPNAAASALFDLIKDHSFQFGKDVLIVTDTHDVIDLRDTNLHNLNAHDFMLT